MKIVPKALTTAVAEASLAIHPRKALKLLAVALCVTGLATGAYAEKPDNPGNPGNGSGGKPDNPGGGGGKPEKPGRGKGDAYSDLVVLYRDAQGAPILTTDGFDCVQPISANPIDGLAPVDNEADGKSVSLIPLGGGASLEGEECDVDPVYEAYVQEVLFGRLNLGRAPTKVLAQQLREVTSNLASSSFPIEIDEAGRLVFYSGEAGIEVDSPGNNLAIHKELQVKGELVDQTQTPIVLPLQADIDDPQGFLDHAAAALGAAAGKGDLINLDLIVYDNRILNIPSSTTVLQTVMGDDGAEYVDYGSYSYTRSSVFPGCVRGLLVDFPTTGATTPFSGTIMNCVFGSISEGGVCSGGEEFTGVTALHGFAQRADDARAVIAFVHDNVVADSTAILPVSTAGVDQAGQDDVCYQP